MSIKNGAILRELIGARLKEERERLGYNQLDFAAIGGASKRSQIDWEQGKLVPNAEFLAMVAAAGADVLYILTGELASSALSKDEKELLSGYRGLDIRGKAGVLALIDGMSAPPANQPVQGPHVEFHGKVGQQITGDITAPQTINMGGSKKKTKD